MSRVTRVTRVTDGKDDALADGSDNDLTYAIDITEDRTDGTHDDLTDVLAAIYLVAQRDAIPLIETLCRD